MSQLNLVNRSGKTIITGDYVKFYPNSRDSFVFADIGDANIIGQAAQTVSSGARCLINLLGSGVVDISGKVDKVTGSSLVPDTEIAKIHEAGSDNQDLSSLADKNFVIAMAISL